MSSRARHDPRPTDYDPRMAPYGHPQHVPYHGHSPPGKPFPNHNNKGQDYFHESPVGVHHQSQRYPEYNPDYYRSYDQRRYNMSGHPAHHVSYTPYGPEHNPHGQNRDLYNQNVYKGNQYAHPTMQGRDPYMVPNSALGYGNFGNGVSEPPYGRYARAPDARESYMPQGEMSAAQPVPMSVPPYSEDEGGSNVSGQGGNKNAGRSTTSSEGGGSSRSQTKQNQHRRLNAKKFALNMELIEHAAHGRVDSVMEKIKQGASLECTDYDQRTPLHAAAAEGHLEVVKLLLKEGASPDVADRWGRKPVDESVRKGFKEISDILQKHGEKDEHTLKKELHDGLELLQHCANGNLHLVREKVRAGTAVTFADYDLRTPLHLACCEGHVDVVDFLLHNGADPYFNDRFGHNAVCDAVRNGHEEVLRLLKSFNIKVPEYIFDKSSTPEFQRNMRLIDTSANGKVGAVQKLICDGADVHFGDYDKRTALHLAACEGHVKVIKLLLAAGANPTCEDRWGRSAHDEAVKYEQEEVLSLLDAHVEGTVRKSG